MASYGQFFNIPPPLWSPLKKSQASPDAVGFATCDQCGKMSSCIPISGEMEALTVSPRQRKQSLFGIHACSLSLLGPVTAITVLRATEEFVFAAEKLFPGLTKCPHPFFWREGGGTPNPHTTHAEREPVGQ